MQAPVLIHLFGGIITQDFFGGLRYNKITVMQGGR